MEEQDFVAILNGEIKGSVYKAQRIPIKGKIVIEEWKLLSKLGQTFTISFEQYHHGLVDTYQRSLDQFNYGSYFLTKEDAIKSLISRLNILKNTEATKINTSIAELENML